MKVICGGYVLGDNIRMADSFFKRLIGLMGRKALENGEGLLLKTSSIHCFFMRLTIDAVYISRKMTVLGIETLRPWEIGRWFSGTKYILELNAGSTGNVTVGDLMILEY